MERRSRSPLKDLTTVNIKNFVENDMPVEKINSVAKNFSQILVDINDVSETLNNSTSKKCGHNEFCVNNIQNDENCDPEYGDILNITIPQRNDIKEFVEGVITEALNNVCPDEFHLLNGRLGHGNNDECLDFADCVDKHTSPPTYNGIEEIMEINGLLEELVPASEIEELYDLTELRDQISSKDDIIAKMKMELLQKDEENANLLREKNQLLDEIYKNGQKLEESKVEMEKMESRLKAKDEILNSMGDHYSNQEIENLKMECKRKDELIMNQQKEFETTMKCYDEIITTQMSEIEGLTHEHGIATRHLTNLEKAFSDLLQKYERSKTIIEGYKVNEENLKCTLATFKKNLSNYSRELEIIQSKASKEIGIKDKELETIKEEHKSEINKCNNKIKHLEIKNSSLSNALEQKIKECEDLTNLYEEIVEK